MMIYKKFTSLLSASELRQLVILLVFMFIGVLLDLMGISLVVPIIALMTRPDIGKNYHKLQPFLNILGSFSQGQLVIGGMLTLVGIYFVKIIFNVGLFWKQFQFVFEMQAKLSYQLFVGYLRQPWKFHLQRNSAQLINTVVIEISQFINSILLPLMVILTDGLVLLGIVILLFIIEPFGSLIIIGTLGLMGGAFHFGIRRHVLRWGQARQFHEEKRLQHLQQGLGGAKEIKLLGREHDFFAQYNIHNLSSARVNHRQRTVSELPRLGIEFLSVVSLAALVLVMVAQHIPVDKILPTMGLFAAAAFRIMPSANRILGNIQSLYFGLPTIDTLSQEIQLFNNEKALKNTHSLSFKHTLKLEHIRYQYSDAKMSTLNDITLTISRGMSVGFVGASGVGKSTLIDIILGLLTPDGGCVKVDGIDIQSNLRGWQNQIGYVPQSIFLTDDTLRRNVAFGLSEELIDDIAVQRAIKATQLEDFISSLPRGIDTHVGERGIRLSGGQRQRIGIARALYHDPAVLVLDEATSALDVATEKEVMKAVNALHGHKTLLIVAHRLSTVANCDWLYDLEKGKIVEVNKVV